MTDNCPQYGSREMEANGLGREQLQGDPYMALLSYRATPLPWCQLSPAELFMGRRISTDVPQVKKLLTPQWPNVRQF